MTQTNSFKIVKNKIKVPPGVHKKPKKNQKVITFCSPSGTIYQFDLPDKKIIIEEALATVGWILSVVSLTEPLLEKQSAQLFSFLHQNLEIHLR